MTTMSILDIRPSKNDSPWEHIGKAFWRELKKQELQSIARLKSVLKDEIQYGCF